MSGPAKTLIRVKLLKPVVWIEDDKRAECIVCSAQFKFTRRKHHCRLCGEVVCESCSLNKVMLIKSAAALSSSPRAKSSKTAERTCDPCYRIALKSYTTKQDHAVRHRLEKSMSGIERGIADSADGSVQAPLAYAVEATGKPRSAGPLRWRALLPPAVLATGAVYQEFVTLFAGGGLFVVLVLLVLLVLLVQHFLGRRQARLMPPPPAPEASTGSQPPARRAIPTDSGPTAATTNCTGVHGQMPACPQFDELLKPRIQWVVNTGADDPIATGWKLYGDKKGVKMFSKAGTADGYKNSYIMGRGVVDAPVRAVLDVVMAESVETSRLLDDMYDKGQILRKINAHEMIKWDLYKGVGFLVAARDLHTALRYQVQDDGTVVVAAVSVPNEANTPVNKGGVRATLNVGGWFLRPLPGDRCEVVYACNFDLGGSVPGYLINKLNQEQPLQISIINNVLKKRDLSPYYNGGERSTQLQNGDEITCSAELEKRLFGQQQ